MTPEQWIEIYGNQGDGTQNDWAAGTLATFDAVWQNGIDEIVSPYTSLVGGGWDIGSSIALELLDVDWDSGSSVGGFITSIVGQVVMEAIESLAEGIPVIGTLASIVFGIGEIGRQAIAEAAAERKADAQSRAKHCATFAQNNYDVRGTGSGGRVMPADWFVQADLGPDLIVRPTGRMPALGQAMLSLLSQWPKSYINELIARTRPPEITIEQWYLQTLGLTIGAGFVEWNNAGPGPIAIGRYRPDYPDFGPWKGPLTTLTEAIADQSAATANGRYVDGGITLLPLWMDLWFDLSHTKHYPWGESTGTLQPVERIRWDVMKILHGGYYSTYEGVDTIDDVPPGVLPAGHSSQGPWQGWEFHRIHRWLNVDWEPLGNRAGPCPIADCAGLPQDSIDAIAGSLENWALQVYPQYGPDKERYEQQLQDAWVALEDFIDGKLGPRFRMIAGSLRTPKTDPARYLRESLGHAAIENGALTPEKVSQENAEDAASGRSYSIPQTATIAAAGAAVVAALLWK